MKFIEASIFFIELVKRNLKCSYPKPRDDCYKSWGDFSISDRKASNGMIETIVRDRQSDLTTVHPGCIFFIVIRSHGINYACMYNTNLRLKLQY